MRDAYPTRPRDDDGSIVHEEEQGRHRRVDIMTTVHMVFQDRIAGQR